MLHAFGEKGDNAKKETAALLVRQLSVSEVEIQPPSLVGFSIESSTRTLTTS